MEKMERQKNNNDRMQTYTKTFTQKAEWYMFFFPSLPLAPSVCVYVCAEQTMTLLAHK